MSLEEEKATIAAGKIVQLYEEPVINAIPPVDVGV